MRKVPKLRFKEFSDEWEEKKFKNFLIEKKEITNEDLDLYSLTIENGIIPKNEKYEREFLVNNKDEAYKKMGKNDFAYNPMNIRFGAVAKFDENKFIKISKYYNIFYCNSKVNSYFFEKYIKIKRMIDFYNKISIGSLNEKKRLHYSEFIEIEQPFPSLQEQEKIANFLTNIDKKISLTEEKLELFREYKKGVMQKIFSQELRFKDSNGNDYPEWEEKRLGEILKVQGGYAFKSEKFTDSGIPIIRISNISNTSNGIDINNLVYYEENSNLENFIINNGDFLIALSGATTGKTSIYNLKQKAYLNQRVGVFRKIQNFYYNFITQYGSSDFFLKQIDNIIVAGAQPNISPKDIENFIIKLPVLEEQQKISDFLSSIDSKIESIEKELEGLKEFKKGLLQQMFV